MSLVEILERLNNIMENLDLKLINILINNRKELSDFVSSAGEGIFESDYKRFVKTLLGYYTNFLSPPTLNTLLEYCGNNSGLKDYIKSIWDNAEEENTDQREYSFILDKINKRYNSLILQSVKDRLENCDDLEGVNNFLSKAVCEIKNIGEKKSKIEATLSESASDYFQQFKAKQQNKELNQGVLSGFSILDHSINGLRKGELAMIAAATGTGKSIFMLNWGVSAWLGQNKFPKNKSELKNISDNNAWLPGKNILFFSLEMPMQELEDRIISNLCSIDNLNLMKGTINEEEAERMSLALNFFKRYPHQFKIIDIPKGCTMNDLQECFDETSKDFSIDLVIVDYMSIMSNINLDSDNDSDWLALLSLSKEMFAFCRANNVPLLTASQLTVSQPGKDGAIGPSRLARSKGILSNVNFCLQISDRVDEQNRPDSEIHSIKCRRGKPFKMNNLLKEFQYSRFVDQPMSSSDIEKQSQLNSEDLSLSIDKIFGQDNLDLD